MIIENHKLQIQRLHKIMKPKQQQKQTYWVAPLMGAAGAETTPSTSMMDSRLSAAANFTICGLTASGCAWTKHCTVYPFSLTTKNAIFFPTGRIVWALPRIWTGRAASEPSSGATSVQPDSSTTVFDCGFT